MREMRVTFTDREFNELKRIKKEKGGTNVSWHFLILRAFRKLKKIERGSKK